MWQKVDYTKHQVYSVDKTKQQPKNKKKKEQKNHPRTNAGELGMNRLEKMALNSPAMFCSPSHPLSHKRRTFFLLPPAAQPQLVADVVIPGWHTQ